MTDPAARNHHRRSIRLQGCDDTRAGAYFVTRAAWRRECLFGGITHGEMPLNELGRIVRAEWLRTSRVRPNVEVREDELVVMPDHLHAIIWIVDAPGCAAVHAPVGATIVGQFKTVSARRINALRRRPGLLLRQRNYDEHIVRSDRGLNNIWNYMDANPTHWESDPENR